MSQPPVFSLICHHDVFETCTLKDTRNPVRSLCNKIRSDIEEFLIMGAGCLLEGVMEVYKEKGLDGVRELDARGKAGLYYRISGNDLEIDYRDGSAPAGEWTFLFSLTEESIRSIEEMEAAHAADVRSHLPDMPEADTLRALRSELADIFFDTYFSDVLTEAPYYIECNEDMVEAYLEHIREVTEE